MRSLLPFRLLLPLGVVLLCSGFILKNFGLIPDFVEGILIGLGAGMIVGSFIKKWYLRRAQ